MARKGKIITFLMFFFLYLGLGKTLESTKAFYSYDKLFQSDVPRVVSDFTAPDEEHDRTTTHPLYVLFFNPAGVMLAKITGSNVFAVLFITSLFGGTCVTMAQLFFEKMGLNSFVSLLWALMLGVSSTHVLFSSIPEAFIISASGIILLFLLAVTRPGSLYHFVPAGIFTLGITITNFFQSVIIFFCSLYYKNFPRRTTRLIIFIALTLLISSGLSMLQRSLYPRSEVFFTPSTCSSELRIQKIYTVKFNTFRDVFLRTVKLSEYFFLYNFIAPRPYVVPFKTHLTPSIIPQIKARPGSFWTRIPAITFKASSIAHFYLPGFFAAILWLILIGVSFYSALRQSLCRTPIILALMGCASFNFLLHLFYGDDLFLYSAHWTFLILAFLAVTLKQYAENRIFILTLIIILCMNVANSFCFFHDLVQIYD